MTIKEKYPHIYGSLKTMDAHIVSGFEEQQLLLSDALSFPAHPFVQDEILKILNDPDIDWLKLFLNDEYESYDFSYAETPEAARQYFIDLFWPAYFPGTQKPD